MIMSPVKKYTQAKHDTRENKLTGVTANQVSHHASANCLYMVYYTLQYVLMTTHYIPDTIENSMNTNSKPLNTGVVWG